MEHRYGKRFSADHKTLIFKNGMPVAIGCISNFSRDGVFVKTEFDLVDINQALEIELIRHDGNRSAASRAERRMCKTFVMHKANGGIGLLVRDDCVETQLNFAAFIADELSRSQYDSLSSGLMQMADGNRDSYDADRATAHR